MQVCALRTPPEFFFPTSVPPTYGGTPTRVRNVPVSSPQVASVSLTKRKKIPHDGACGQLEIQIQSMRPIPGSSATKKLLANNQKLKRGRNPKQRGWREAMSIEAQQRSPSFSLESPCSVLKYTRTHTASHSASLKNTRLAIPFRIVW